MTIVFGEMVAHEATTTFFMLATVLGYLEWRRRGRAAWLWGAGGAFVLGALSGWPAYYLAVVLPLHHVWASRPRRPSPGPFDARRDARGPDSRGHWDGYGAIVDSARLRDVLAAHPRDSLAFVSEQALAPEVDAWLERRYPWETFDVRGTRYRLYHIRPYERPPEPPAGDRPAR